MIRAGAGARNDSDGTSDPWISSRSAGIRSMFKKHIHADRVLSPRTARLCSASQARIDSGNHSSRPSAENIKSLAVNATAHGQIVFPDRLPRMIGSYAIMRGA